MARKPSPITSVTAYLLEGSPELDAHIRERYLKSEDFATSEVTVGGRSGQLVTGRTPERRPPWVGTLEGWLGTSMPEVLHNTTAAGCLLPPTHNGTRTWALCFGMGFQLLEPALIIPGIGRAVAVRTADPDHLKSLTHSRLDSRAYIARASVPGGDVLDAFGVSGVADLVTRVVAPANLAGTTAGSTGKSPQEIRGADSLKVPLARDPKALIGDLDAIEALIGQPPVPALAEVEQLSALRVQDPRIGELEALLGEALGDETDERVGLAWPTEAADIAVPIHHLFISGLPRDFPSRDEYPVELASLLAPLQHVEPGMRIDRLRRMRVQAFSDEEDAASGLVAAKRWIVAEFHLDGRRYCLHDGRWYEIDHKLTDRIGRRLNRLFDAASLLPPLPAWTEGDEETYNHQLATTLGGVCLDRRLLRTEQHPKGFEACDVLTPQGVLLHVKKVDRSSPASHLFAQAAVSMESLLVDSQARGVLRDLVEASGGDASWVHDRPPEVALVMARVKPITADDFFSFSRVRLARIADEADRSGTPLTVHWVSAPL